MKIVFGVGSKLFIWDTSISRIVVKDSTESEDEIFDHIPQDPHGTLSSHMEISPEAIGAYGKRRFGFGSESTSG